MIIDGLRPQSGQIFGSSPQDPGNDGDTEEYSYRPKARARGGPKRRSQSENLLSVSIRPYNFNYKLTQD